MSNPAISVIVPVYNVKDYLEKSINSILSQTFRDLEVILVDDGSTDGSGDVCDRFAAEDSRIRVVHKENGGLSSARNAGLDIAQGELIGFIDSDDWIDADMYETLYRFHKEEDADVAVCGWYMAYPDRTDLPEQTSGVTVMTPAEAIKSALAPKGVGLTAWNKLYRRHLFETMRFPEGKLYEDAFVTIPVLGMANKTVFCREPKYYYVHRTDSISNKPFRSKDMDMIEAVESNYDYITENYPELIDHARRRRFAVYFVLLDKILLGSDPDSHPEKKEIVRYLRSNIGGILSNPLISSLRKLSALLLCVHEKLYKAMTVYAAKRKQ